MKGLVFTYLLTYGGALVALFNPYLGLLIYICFAIIKPESLWYWSVPEGNYSRIVALALLAGWAFKGLGQWRLGKAAGVVAALLAYLAWSIFSAVQAVEPGLAWKSVEELAKVVLPFLVGVSLIDSVAKLKQLAWVIVLSQGYVAYELNMAYYSGFNRVAEIGFGGVDNNGIAIAMDTCIGLAFFLGLGTERWWQKGLAILCSLLMIHVVLMSFSRGGMLSLIITSAVMFLLIPKTARHYALFAVMILIGARLAGDQVVERFQTIFASGEQRDWSAASRQDLWRDALDCAMKHPLLGVGPANWGQVAPRYGWPLGKEVHSTWIQLMAEVGFPGQAFLVAFYALCVKRLWPYVRESEPVFDPWVRSFARMVIAAVTGYALSAQFVTIAGLEAPYYVVLLGAGALKLVTLNPVDDGGAEEQPGEGLDNSTFGPVSLTSHDYSTYTRS
jgi:putative inorganic carbon (HCO3(-)) transporter